MATRTIIRGICSKKLAGPHQLFHGLRSSSRCFHGLVARPLKPHRVGSQSQTASTPLAQSVRHCHTAKGWPPALANRAHDMEDIAQDKYDKTVEANSHNQSGGRTFGDGHDEVEHRKEFDDMIHRVKLLLKEVEVVMDNMDKSSKKKLDNLVKMVDDAQKVIALQRSLDSDDEKRRDGFENKMGDAEAGDGGVDQHDENGRNDLVDENNDDDLGTGPDDVKHRLAALEIKANVLKMDINDIRSQANADSTIKSMEKTIRLTEKLPRD